MQTNHTVIGQFEPYFAGTTVPASGSGGGDTCRFDTSIASTRFVAVPTTLPVGQAMPQGMFQCKLIDCDATTVTMAITWPQTVLGLSKFGMATAAATERTHFAPNGLKVGGKVTEFTVQDGKLGDDDWRVNGDIVDPVGLPCRPWSTLRSALHLCPRWGR